MPESELMALLMLATAVSFTPGPNTTLSTALAANFGLRRALGFVLAVPVGWGLLLSLCAAGLGALVMAVPVLRMAIQAGGCAYLVWLAWKLARTQSLSPMEGQRLQVSFWQGVLLQFVNIKAWMLALAIVAGWLTGRPDALSRFALILPVMLAFGLCSNLLYASAGSLLRHWLGGPYHQGVGSALRLRWFNRAMACVLLITAVWMALQ